MSGLGLGVRVKGLSPGGCRMPAYADVLGDLSGGGCGVCGGLGSSGWHPTISAEIEESTSAPCFRCFSVRRCSASASKTACAALSSGRLAAGLAEKMRVIEPHRDHARGKCSAAETSALSCANDAIALGVVESSLPFVFKAGRPLSTDVKRKLEVTLVFFPWLGVAANHMVQRAAPPCRTRLSTARLAR